MSTPKYSNSKLVRCKKCYRLICKRIPVHLGDDEGWILEVVHKGMTIYAYDATVSCPICRSAYRINGKDGIIGKELNELYSGK